MASIYQVGGDDDWDYGTLIAGTVPSPLQLVQDMDDPGRGPAYQFQVMYNKVVIAPAAAFSPTAVPAGSSKTKRDHSHRISEHWHTRHQVSPGDQPWMCYWNSTLVEFFIYIENNATSWPNASSLGSGTWGQGSTTSAPSGASATPISSSCSTASEAYGATATHGSSSSASSGSCASNSHDGFGPTSSLPSYPYVAKLEERRIPGSPAPYCQKVQILNNGQAVPLTDPETGNIYTVNLQETDPGTAAYASVGLTSKAKRKRTIVPGACHCQWLSGAS